MQYMYSSVRDKCPCTGSVWQLPYKFMQIISPISAHAGQNRELCLSTHEHLPRVTPVQHSKKLMPTAQAGGDIQYDSAESIV